MNNESSSQIQNQIQSPEPKTPLSKSKIPSLNYYHPSPSRTIYSDRFIPSRSASNFALFGLSPPPPAAADTSPSSSSSSSANYTALLRNALFGSDLGFVPPSTPDKNNFSLATTSPVSRNIFRFKSQTKQSLHSLSPFGVDNQLPVVSHRPAKAPRIVPRSPYKVRIHPITSIFG